MKLTFKLHKTVIIVICVALVTLLMHGISYLGNSQNQGRIEQFKQLTYVLAKQVAFSLSDYIVPGSKDFNLERINANLNNVVKDRYILDASIYTASGTLITQVGEPATVKERLAIDDNASLQNFQYQLVVPIQGTKEPKGYLRLTIDTELLSAEIQQADNSTNVLRIFILLALCIGFVLANTLLRLKKKKGHRQAPPLVVNTDENQDDNGDDESNEDDQESKTSPKTKPARLKRKKEQRPYRPKRPTQKNKPNSSDK
ncbi:AhpA/YtjB family protein [Providencia huaxiensis]|uniref:AhpA/YtjB family protein n=1 Tax=Providencia TaxID=586 RepID=UPI00205E75B9|nr:AhpA/YtjB family protein [Providencia rettgeri]ELR5075894.1 protein smp [Providencia stuartii]UPS63654.1 AhpA/YtjB family protein [Providencia rettgeri]